jgi:Asp/Glu/hydantoin racemase
MKECCNKIVTLMWYNSENEDALASSHFIGEITDETCNSLDGKRICCLQDITSVASARDDVSSRRVVGTVDCLLLTIVADSAWIVMRGAASAVLLLLSLVVWSVGL